MTAGTFTAQQRGGGLKLAKRAMFDRATFNLLRKRVLYRSDPDPAHQEHQEGA